MGAIALLLVVGLRLGTLSAVTAWTSGAAWLLPIAGGFLLVGLAMIEGRWFCRRL
jgi:hypothetical protein